MTAREQFFLTAIQRVLTPDLLRPEFKARADNPMYGHCYHASEALFHILGGKANGYSVRRAVDASGTPHYWLVNMRGEVLDPTEAQYRCVGQEPPYEQGKGVGFRRMSKSAQKILERLELP